ncbi:hypothetical protein D3C81_2075280 [compost metagenome]
MAMASASAREWVDFMAVSVCGARQARLMFVSGSDGLQAAASREAPIKNARAGAAKHCRGCIVPDPVIARRTRRGWQVARAWRMLRLFAA